MAIVIKKRVSLEFLGEEYQDAYITFQSIPLSKYDEIIDQQTEDKKGYLKFIISTLKKYFLDGKFPGIEELEADDLDGLDEDSCIRCFQIITGQIIDPKAQTPSTNSSPMADLPPSNS